MVKEIMELKDTDLVGYDLSGEDLKFTINKANNGNIQAKLDLILHNQIIISRLLKIKL